MPFGNVLDQKLYVNKSTSAVRTQESAIWVGRGYANKRGPPAGCATDGATRPQRHRSCFLHTAQLNLALSTIMGHSWATSYSGSFSRGDQSYSCQNKRGRRQAGATRFTSLSNTVRQSKCRSAKPRPFRAPGHIGHLCFPLFTKNLGGYFEPLGTSAIYVSHSSRRT